MMALFETLVTRGPAMLCRSCRFAQKAAFVHTSSTNGKFWEPYRKSGYGKQEKMTFLEKILKTDMKSNLKSMKKEFRLLREELKELIITDPAIVKPGDSDYVFKFDNQEVMDNFNIVSDKDHNEGFSECEFRMNKYKKGVFKGVLTAKVPKDGKIARAGYCNITSQRVRKSFKRESYYEWSMYTHLVMRVRGDGRPYMVNLVHEGSFDLTWNDIYSYVLYTRGGPYWQMAKIPFSKFYLSSKGRVQDKQSQVPLNHITNVGITCADEAQGPFQLEIDYIGILSDPSHTEEFAYEMYEVPPFIVGS